MALVTQGGGKEFLFPFFHFFDFLEKLADPCFSNRRTSESMFFDPEHARINVYRQKETCEFMCFELENHRARKRKKGRVTRAMVLLCDPKTLKIDQIFMIFVVFFWFLKILEDSDGFWRRTEFGIRSPISL